MCPRRVCDPQQSLLRIVRTYGTDKCSRTHCSHSRSLRWMMREQARLWWLWFGIWAPVFDMHHNMCSCAFGGRRRGSVSKGKRYISRCVCDHEGQKNAGSPTGSTQKGSSLTLFLFHYFFHNSLLSCLSPSTVRGKYSCRDSRPLGQGHPTRPHAFPGTTCQGHVATQSHLCQLPILQEKRDLATRPIQPDDVQRIVAHIAFSRATGRHFRLPTKLRLRSPTLDSLGSPFSLRSQDQEHDIHLLRLFLLPPSCARQ